LSETTHGSAVNVRNVLTLCANTSSQSFFFSRRRAISNVLLQSVLDFNQSPTLADPLGQSGNGPIRSINGNCSQPAKNFACTDEYRAIYSTYQAKIHISVLTRRFFRSQNGQKCVGGRSLPRTQLRSLQRCPRPLAGLRGGIGKDKGGEGKDMEKDCRWGGWEERGNWPVVALRVHLRKYHESRFYTLLRNVQILA